LGFFFVGRDVVEMVVTVVISIDGGCGGRGDGGVTVMNLRRWWR